MGSATISVDEFQALEQKVLQAVELIRKERDARAAAESERDSARSQLQTTRSELHAAQIEAAELRGKLETVSHAQGEVEALHREREAVRVRVEKMLAQMDELL
jgi:uncharacterized protein (DUF3084 family)